MQKETTDIERSLRVTLTEIETLEFGRAAARCEQRIEQLQENMKSAQSAFKTEIAEQQAIAKRCTNAINNGYENRDTACRVTFGAPRRNWKQIVRLDTGEMVAEEPMTKSELQGEMPFDD